MQRERICLVSCLLQARRHQVRRICGVEYGDSTSVVVLAGSGTAPLSGSVRGGLDLKLEGLSKGSTVLATYTPTVEVRRGGKVLGAIIPAGPFTKIRSNPDISAEERMWLRVLALLQASLTDPRDGDADALLGQGTVNTNPPPPLDAYDLRARKPTDGVRGGSLLEGVGQAGRRPRQTR